VTSNVGRLRKATSCGTNPPSYAIRSTISSAPTGCSMAPVPGVVVSGVVESGVVVPGVVVPGVVLSPAAGGLASSPHATRPIASAAASGTEVNRREEMLFTFMLIRRCAKSGGSRLRR
jgi:hypothetical protein